MSSSLRTGIVAALLCLPLGAVPALAAAHGGPGFQRPIPQSPLIGLPPTYNPPSNMPPTYVPPGTPPWAIPSAPPPGPVSPFGAPANPGFANPGFNQFFIPSDPGLNQRNLLDEELRLREDLRRRSWEQGRWRNDEGFRDSRDRDHDHDRDERRDEQWRR